MEKIDARKAIQEITADIRLGRCVFFIGREVPSRLGGMPSNLEMASELQGIHCRAEHSLRQFPIQPLSLVAQCCIKEHGPFWVNEQILKIINQREKTTRSASRIYELLAHLYQLKAILTTAWDASLERAFDQRGRSVNVIADDTRVPGWSGQDTNIVKLLGSPGGLNCAVTECDVDLINQMNPALCRLAANLLTTSSLVVLGYSHDEDIAFRSIYSLVRHQIKTAYSRTMHAPRWPTYVIGSYRDLSVELLETEGVYVIDITEENFVEQVARNLRSEVPTATESVPELMALALNCEARRMDIKHQLKLSSSSMWKQEKEANLISLERDWFQNLSELKRELELSGNRASTEIPLNTRTDLEEIGCKAKWDNALILAVAKSVSNFHAMKRIDSREKSGNPIERDRELWRECQEERLTAIGEVKNLLSGIKVLEYTSILDAVADPEYGPDVFLTQISNLCNTSRIEWFSEFQRKVKCYQADTTDLIDWLVSFVVKLSSP